MVFSQKETFNLNDRAATYWVSFVRQGIVTLTFFGSSIISIIFFFLFKKIALIIIIIIYVLLQFMYVCNNKMHLKTLSVNTSNCIFFFLKGSGHLASNYEKCSWTNFFKNFVYKVVEEFFFTRLEKIVELDNYSILKVQESHSVVTACAIHKSFVSFFSSIICHFQIPSTEKKNSTAFCFDSHKNTTIG